MKDYRQSGRQRFSRDRGKRGATMTDAICDQCGKKCKVPFKPSGDKPVYCSDCFEKQSGKRSDRKRRSGGDFRRDNRRGDFNERKKYLAVCDNCGMECEVPFKPSGDKPVFCEECFSKVGNRRSERKTDRPQVDNNLQEQINQINSKIDRILQKLESVTAPEEEPEKKVGTTEPTVKKEPSKKKSSSSKKETPKKTSKKTTQKTKKTVKKTPAKKATKTKKKVTKTKKSSSKKK